MIDIFGTVPVIDSDRILYTTDATQRDIAAPLTVFWQAVNDFN